MPLNERASIFKGFDALPGLKEEIRKAEIRHAKKYERGERIYKYGKE